MWSVCGWFSGVAPSAALRSVSVSRSFRAALSVVSVTASLVATRKTNTVVVYACGVRRVAAPDLVCIAE